jgi:hypothetical protein
MSIELLDEREVGAAELARVEAGAVEAITRAEIDSQVATAKKYPRTYKRFLTDAQGMIAASPTIAEKCRYILPARKGSREPIQGPSVRMAEIVAACWGNLRIVGRIVADDGVFLTAQGMCLDLERNVGYSVEVKRSVRGRDGRRFSDDMVKVTGNAAIAIATRNATFKVVPRSFVQELEDYSIQVARGDERSLPDRASRAIQHFMSKGATDQRIFAALGVQGFVDLTLDHLDILNGYRVSLAEGMATIDELFPAPEVAQPAGKGAAALAKRLAAAKAPEQAEPVPAEDLSQEDLRATEGGNDD